ncbi:MAG: hypothetical protein JNM63_18715, partial [Spirochaetia bacterium]|nr:hypothetical protein [Spirochaetia bacterium]
NLIWCESFQQAWNLFGKEVCGEAPKLGGAPEAASKLNLSFGKGPSIDPESLFLRAGEITPSFIEEINVSLKKKFGEAAPAPLGPNLERGFLVYAFLFKDLRFPIPFDRQTNTLTFVEAGGSFLKVESFGIPEVNGSVHPSLISQIGILHDVPGEYIIELKSKSKQDRIVLARVSPDGTLSAAIDATMKRMRKAPAAFSPQTSDQILVPRISLDATRVFSELIGREILNAKINGSVIRDARSSVRFSLDAGGASARSEAKIRSVKNGHAPRRIVFDRPFLLLLLNASSNKPYLAIRVENAEILASTANVK